MFSPPWQYQTVHVLLSCYQASAFAMAGIHAFVLLRDPGSGEVELCSTEPIAGGSGTRPRVLK